MTFEGSNAGTKVGLEIWRIEKLHRQSTLRRQTLTVLAVNALRRVRAGANGKRDYRHLPTILSSAIVLVTISSTRALAHSRVSWA